MRGQRKREPATRFSITPSREPAASSGKPGGASWPHAQPGYQKQQGALYRQLLDTPTAPKPARTAASGGGRVGRSQSELWQSADDCWRRLRAAGARGRSGAAVVDRCRALAAPGAVDPGAEAVCAQPLLIPLRLKVTEEKALAAEKAALAQLGIDVHTDALQHVTVRAVPLPLRQQNLQILIPELIGYLAQQNAFDAGNIAQWMARNLTSEQTSWNMAQAIALLADVERLCPQLVKTPPGGLLQPVDLHSAMNALKDE